MATAQLISQISSVMDTIVAGQRETGTNLFFYRVSFLHFYRTDDSDQMILILETLLEKGKADPKVFAKKLYKYVRHYNYCENCFLTRISWIYHGFPELGDKAGMGMLKVVSTCNLINYSGLGATTAKVTDHPNFLKDPITTARAVWEASGRQAAPNGRIHHVILL